MIDLKLAEYDLESFKFKRFLKLQKDFLYAGKYIKLLDHIEIQGKCVASDYCYKEFWIDDHDPCSRFNGLFNGRTYGAGMFVLIENDEDTFFEQGEAKVYHPEEFPPHIRPTNPVIETIKESKKWNLHENPELYKLIK